MLYLKHKYKREGTAVLLLNPDNINNDQINDDMELKITLTMKIKLIILWI